jgi:large subunit ribosomal protein L25
MTITLAVTERDTATAVDILRANGSVPAVVYGPKQEAIHITIDGKDFTKVRKEAGESTIVELSGLKSNIEVLIKDIEFNPVTQHVMHVDFYAIEQGKAITTNVSLEFIGEAPIESSKIGMINKVLHEVEVTCLPADLPNHIDVSLESLVTLEDKISIKDLILGKGVTVNADADDSVVGVSALRKEGEEAPVVVLDMDTIEVMKKGKGETSGEGEDK